MTTPASIRRRPALVATTTPSIRPARTMASWTKAWSRTRAPAPGTRRLPGDLEVLGVVRDAGPGAVRVGALDDRPERAAGPPRRRRRRRRRPCAGTRPASRSRRRCRARRCWCRRGRGASRRAGSWRRRGRRRWRPSSLPTQSRRRGRRPGRRSPSWPGAPADPGACGGSGSTAVTDQPPSTASSWPVIMTDVVGEQEERRPGDVDRVDEAAGERLLAGREGDRGRVGGGAGGHRRVGQGGRQAVDPDAVPGSTRPPSRGRAR